MKHLNFLEEWSKTGKTKVITILSMHDDTKLGTISWSGAWRQYVFSPVTSFETIWSHDCLEDLRNFIIVLNKEQKERNKDNISQQTHNILNCDYEKQ